MDKFSVFCYETLSLDKRCRFNRMLAKNLFPLLNELKSDDVLGDAAAIEFVTSTGDRVNAADVVSKIYIGITGGIQAGSGNQFLYNCVLQAYVDAWNDINKSL